ncbi:hypothetical protein V5O48_005031 [Marasmius crinis-equi]|uniref:RRM domain-containing protein n=1 Tax=Marasmius crinis-equi TaxID=585013 RepID=A0ABR3FNV4_9AGAR
MSRPDGLDYDYPPGLLQGGIGRLWDNHQPSTGPNRNNVTSPISSATPSFTDTSSSSTTIIPNPLSSSSLASRTLFWGDLEPWMDEEYVKQVCALMGWEPQSTKVPSPNGPNANNPGYCFLTFPTQAHASSVIAQLNSAATPPIMPNSAKPFHINWASSVQLPSSAPSTFSPSGAQPQAQSQQYPTEYSIFVGDLAPETSNSDLVAVFRNPVLGLRNDREPKFIRPFLSCKSAKIMLDPVTGVSRGYGFVRFTDEADQQRALIEMHGLYCLSRPMRISPATAKFKPPPTTAAPAQPVPPFQINPQQSVTLALPLSSSHQGSANATNMSTNTSGAPNQPKSVSSPIAATAPIASGAPISTSSLDNTGGSGANSPGSGTSSSTSNSSLASTATAFSNGASDTDVKLLAQQIGPQQYTGVSGTTSPDGKPAPQQAYGVPGATSQSGQAYVSPPTDLPSTTKYLLTEESWKHHAQARAILGNLIGPNGEQLTITDPYNTTVFVGGLSPLINEDTLRTFFAPFGDIHYVKVPVGKNCGFVQFVRKADAEKAIEKMQGFPIGGSRIRLSWGRSQYKAAQAAAQAAQAAAMQLQGQYGVAPNPSAAALGGPAVPASLAHIHPLLQSMAGQTSNASSIIPNQASSQNQQVGSAAQSIFAGVNLNALSQEQAIQLLQKLSAGGMMDIPVAADERQHGRQMDMGTHGFSSGAEHQQTSFVSNATHPQHQQNEHMGALHHHLHSPGAGLYAEEKLRAAHLASREDALGGNNQMRHQMNQAQNQLGMFDHSIYGFGHSATVGDRRPSVIGGSSFSPFSPDPNGTSTPSNGDVVGSLPRRESVVSAGSIGDMHGNHVHGMNLSFNGQSVSNSSSPAPAASSLSAKVSPTTARPASTLSRYGSFSAPSQGIPSPVSGTAPGGGSGRASIGGAVISRPASGQQYQQHQQHQQQHPTETLDAMHDLNGTLASLDLDSSPHPPSLGSPTSTTFNPSRPIPHFGGTTWSMGMGSHHRSSLKGPAAEAESSGSPDSKQYLSSSSRGDDRESLRAVSPM